MSTCQLYNGVLGNIVQNVLSDPFRENTNCLIWTTDEHQKFQKESVLTRREFKKCKEK